MAEPTKRIRIAAHPDTWANYETTALVDTLKNAVREHPEGIVFEIVSDPKCVAAIIYYGDPPHIVRGL